MADCKIDINTRICVDCGYHLPDKFPISTKRSCTGVVKSSKTIVTMGNREQIAQPLTIEQKIGVGPGTELTRLIPDFFSSADCGCKNFAKLMNSWGVDGCRENKQQIIDRLVEQSNNTVLLKLFPDGVTSIVASKMIDKAIKNYEERVNNEKA